MPRQRPRRRLGRPPQSDGVETERCIVESARIAFSRYGFESTTNQRIAELADIAPSTLYHYFESKLDLYMAVRSQTNTFFHEVFATAAGSDLPLVERLHRILYAALEVH